MTDTRASVRTTLVVALLALVVYLPSLGNGFAFDDGSDIRDNPSIVDASGPLDVVLSPYRGWVPRERSSYRPVMSLSLWANWVAADDNPFAFHAVNVLLHVAASALVVQLLLALGCTVPGSLVGGALFAVHPVHVEAVANVVGRADVLATLFCLLAALAFLSRRLGPVWRAAAVAAAYALALGSKELAVVLPGLLVVLLWVGPGRPGDETSTPFQTLRRELPVLAPTIVVLAGYLALRLSVVGRFVHRDTAPYITVLRPLDRVTTAVANLTELGRLLVVPVDLAADYGPDVIEVAGLWAPRFWLGVLTVALCVALAWRLRRRQRLGTAALVWIGLSILVVSNLAFPIGVWVAERTLYLASVGVAMGAAALVGVLGARARQSLRGVFAAAALACALGAWKTVERIPVWQDTETVLRTLAEEHPESYRGQWWLALRLSEVGDHDGALRWFEQAARANPNDMGLTLDHARALILAGRPLDAERLLTPLPPTNPARFVYLAQSRIMTDRLDEARGDVRDGLARFPEDERLIGQARDLGIER